jgi:hypothetical protein
MLPLKPSRKNPRRPAKRRLDMTVTDKIQKLNTLAENLRLNIKGIADLFENNSTIQHLVWKINKQISLLHQEVCRTLEHDITDEEFQRIVKDLEEYLKE